MDLSLGEVIHLLKELCERNNLGIKGKVISVRIGGVVEDENYWRVQRIKRARNGEKKIEMENKK